MRSTFLIIYDESKPCFIYKHLQFLFVILYSAFESTHSQFLQNEKSKEFQEKSHGYVRCLSSLECPNQLGQDEATAYLHSFSKQIPRNLVFPCIHCNLPRPRLSLVPYHQTRTYQSSHCSSTSSPDSSALSSISSPFSLLIMGTISFGPGKDLSSLGSAS
jgi:hypothetical protein